jgi:hypothetical protein
MSRSAMKILSLTMLLFVLALPSLAQNTKGDRPASSRETRFRKSDNKHKSVKRRHDRTNSVQTGYTPRRIARGGEHAGKPTSRIRRVRSSPNSSARNVYHQRYWTSHSSASKIGRQSDKPVSNKSTLSRLERLQGPEPRPSRTKPRVIPRTKSHAYVARKSINVQARYPRPKKRGEKAYTKDITGRKIRSRNYHSPRPAQVNTPINGRWPSATKPARTDRSATERFGRFQNYSSARQPSRKKFRLIPTRSISQAQHVFYRQGGRFVNNPAKKPKSSDSGASNAGTLSRLSKLQSSPSVPGRGRLSPRSGSRSFLARKSTNVWAHFARPKHKSEVAVTRDIAGKKLRTRNYHSKPQEVITLQTRPASQRRKIGERPYGGTAKGYLSISGKGHHAWSGDIAGRRIHGARKPGSDRPSRLQPGGYASITVPGEKLTGKSPVAVKQPGVWGDILRFATAKIHGRKTKKGGGTASGFWNNENEPVISRLPPKKALKINSIPQKVSRREYGNQGEGFSGFVKQRAKSQTIGRGGKYQGSIKAQKPVKGGGSISGSWNNKNSPIAPRIPGENGRKIQGFQGTLKAQRPVKGGGSVSGRVWNNEQSAINVRMPGQRALPMKSFQGNLKAQRRKRIDVSGFPGKTKTFGNAPGFSNQGEGFTGFSKYKKSKHTIGKGGQFQGNLKGMKPVKGGGSVSGEVWNNKNNAIAPRIPGVNGRKMQGFQGTLKAQRQVKGGGSVSGQVWNNKNTPIAPRLPGANGRKMQGFQGTLKAQRPVKGGGSVSGQVWNNKTTPIAPRLPGANGRKMQGFQGTLKAQRPVKGGGSVSGKLWNNEQAPINVRMPDRRAEDMRSFQGNVKLQKRKRVDVSGFPGKMKMFGTAPGFANQGEEFTGFIRYKKPKHTIGKGGDFQGNLKGSKPVKGGGSVSGKLWNNSEKPIAVRTPGPSAADAGNYTGTLKLSRLRRDYIKNPNSSALATLKKRPNSSVYTEGKLQSRVKQPHYIRNKTAADEALKTKEPGKSFARSGDYQGNIKMHKFKLFEGNRELHPDARFIRTNKNNVDEERDLLTNFKLWWARLFRKNETQPDHLKEKIRKPRYDKGEEGMWYD